MEFNVAQLLKAAVGDSRVYEIEEGIGELEGAPTTAALAGHIRMTRMPRTVMVEASFRTAVTLSCSRCVEEFAQPLTIEFVEEYEPTIDVESGVPVVADEETDEQRFRIDENHILDLTEAVREYGLLALPMRPMCRSDCRGLCPKCGQNLNVAQCGCSAQSVDSRLSILQKLLEEEKE